MNILKLIYVDWAGEILSVSIEIEIYKNNKKSNLWLWGTLLK